MQIRGHVPGLVKRVAYSLPNHAVVVEETWDLDAPRCPMVANPFTVKAEFGSSSRWMRRLRLTQDEFSMAGMWLGVTDDGAEQTNNEGAVDD